MLWSLKKGVKYNIYIYIILLILIILYNRSAPHYTFTKNLHLHFAFAKKELNDTFLAVPWKIIDKFKKIFTPLQAHGKGKITAWRSGKFSLATQKNMAVLDK